MVGETSAGKLVVEIVGDVAGLTRAYDEAVRRTEGLEGDLKSIGSRMTSIGSDLMLKVTTPLALTGGMMVKTAADFDDSMRKVAAVTRATGDQFDRLRQLAIDLGATTAWSASESAAAMQYLGMAGLDTNEILEATPQMLSLASAGAMDLGAAADIATNALSGFNLEISDLAHVSDVLAQAAASSNTSVEQLGYAMAYVGPVASSAGLSIEETTAAIQVLSNAGIQGTMAGTALRGALTSLLSPTKQATDILATYGLTAEDVNPEVHSLAEILDTLSSAALSTADAMSLFGDRAGPGMIALLRAGGAGIRDYTATLEDCDGAAQRMAETMEGGVGGSLRELEGAIETLSITLGDLIADALMPAIEGATSLANWISNLDEGTQRIIVTTGLLAAATGPVIWGVGALTGSVGQLISLYRTYQASTIAATVATRGFSAALMSTPAGLVLTGITLLAGALLTLSLNTDRAADAANQYTDALSRTSDELRKMADETRSAETLFSKVGNTISIYLTENVAKLQKEFREMEDELGQVVTWATRGADALIELAFSTETADGETSAFFTTLGQVADKLKEYPGLLEQVGFGLGSIAESFGDARIAARLAEADTYEYLATLKDVAQVAETELQRADKAFRDHQTTVSNLQTEYSKLELEYRQMCDAMEEARNRALGIDKEIESSERDIERAEIRKIRAEQRLKEIEDAIKEVEREHYSKEYQTRSDWQAAEDALNELRLREREARLDLADAIARYDEAVKKSADLKQEKTDLEIQLNDESIASAKARLEELARQIDEETKKMNDAQVEREEAERVHQIAMNALEQAGTEKRMMDWATAKKWIEENPIIAKIYHVSYDETGTPSYTPEIPVVAVTPPTLEALDISTVGRGGAGQAVTPGVTTMTSTERSGDVVIEQLNVYSPKADAGTMMQEVRSSLRDFGSQVVI